MNDDTNKKMLVQFENNEIRRVWNEETSQWFFAVVDVVKVLTDSKDPRQYIKRMRQRDSGLNAKWGTICTPLRLLAPDGKMRKTNCANTEGLLRIIQSIPSAKAEPFKQWLATIGRERLEEIENPELIAERFREQYRQKGYSDEWIEARMRSIDIRKELTNEWQNRGVQEGKEYAYLTAEISRGTFGVNPSEHKELKRLPKKQNLRDHMSNAELVFTMLGELSTTQIAKSDDAQGYGENEKAARKGGSIAGNARRELEAETGKSVVSERNYLEQPESQPLLTDQNEGEMEE